MHGNQKGFGLVEVMVGLLIGMLAMVVVMQVFATAEGQKRTTTGGADAQSNGAIGLYMIERDAKMAGWGMEANRYANCASGSTYSYCDGSAACGGSSGTIAGFTLASLVITDGGTGPDTVSAQFFSNPTLDSFRYPTTTTLRSTMPQSSSELNVTSTAGCNVGDLVLVSQAGKCTLMQITHVQGQALKLQHNPGGSGIYNPPANVQNANGWPAYSTGATLACFAAAGNGPMFRRTYSVNTARRQLLRSDNSVSPAITDEVVVPEIVEMQAEYGIAPTGSQVVDTWVAASGVDWANPSLANRKRIKAVRIALVARSAQYEKPTSAGCTTTTATMAGAWSSWATFNPTGYGSDWGCYRYKVFETIVPLRNVMWSNL